MSIRRQVNHLTRLVDDLLDVSRIASGKVELKKEIIELSEVVTRALEVASPLLEQRAHTLVLELEEGVTVDGDVSRLTQVVSNLLTNAGKYTPSGGRITVSTRVEGDEAVLRVRDTGMGMSPEVLPTVFERFVQGRQAVDRAQGGLGLGLTIVQSLVERHGGRVSAHSDGVDAGSELVVRLPRAQASAATVAAAPTGSSEELASAPRGALILVVDDNEDAAEMLGEALTMLGHRVHVAHDGPQALRLAAGLTFDVALLDIGLPVMDGYELAMRLRKMANLQNMRLMALTGYGQPSDRRRSTAAGFDHHLVKPVDLQRLETLISNATPEPRR